MTTRDKLVTLADELACDAATYAAGTPTRKLLHKAADALRLASRQEVSVTVEELARFLDPRPFDDNADDPNLRIRRKQFITVKARALLVKYSITKRTE